MSTVISAQMVNGLRAATGAGLLDCKKALTEANGDVAAATKQLQEVLEHMKSIGCGGFEFVAGRPDDRVFRRQVSHVHQMHAIDCNSKAELCIPAIRRGKEFRPLRINDCRHIFHIWRNPLRDCTQRIDCDQPGIIQPCKGFCKRQSDAQSGETSRSDAHGH